MTSAAHRLKRYLDAVLEEDGMSGPYLLKQVTGVAALPEITMTAVQEVSCRRSVLEEIARRSYAHPNGFDKIVLLSSQEPEFKLRLHIWWPSDGRSAPEAQDIHDHRWDFASGVLAGTFDVELYQELDDEGMAVNPTKVTKYRYSPPGDSDHFSIEHIGSAALRNTFRCSVQPGVTYKISHDMLHRVTADASQLTATVFLQRGSIKGFTNVFRKEARDLQERVPIERFTPDELADRLNELLSLLS